MMKLGSVRSSKIENTEQLEKKLRSIKYNPRLLGVFLKNIRMAKDGTYAVLYDRLVKNLELNKEAESEEKTIWEERRSRLQRINPRLDLRFRFDPTSLKSVLEDPKYQIVKGIYLKRLESKKDQLGVVAFGCLQVIKLEGDLTPDLKNALMESLKGFDPSSISENHLGGLISSTLSILYKLRAKNEIDNAVLSQAIQDISVAFNDHLNYEKLKPLDASIIFMRGPSMGVQGTEKLEPLILSKLSEFYPGMILRLLLKSIQLQNVSDNFKEILAFNLSLCIDQLSIRELVEVYQILSPRMRNRTGRAISPELERLLHGCLKQSIPKLVQLLKKDSGLTVQAFIPIVEYFVFQSPQSQRAEPTEILLEMLCLQLTRLKGSMDHDSFVKVYGLLAETGVNSTAMTDHFNKTLYELVQEDLRNPANVARLEGRAISGQTTPSESDNDSSAQDVVALKRFLRTLNYSWAYFQFCFKTGEKKYVDIQLMLEMVRVLNIAVGLV